MEALKTSKVCLVLLLDPPLVDAKWKSFTNELKVHLDINEINTLSLQDAGSVFNVARGVSHNTNNGLVVVLTPVSIAIDIDIYTSLVDTKHTGM